MILLESLAAVWVLQGELCVVARFVLSAPEFGSGALRLVPYLFMYLWLVNQNCSERGEDAANQN